mmetsp:Transcript_23913/g.49831  ORF Transcript_23913/g.49831 Transcript_23913/m.49831 type:complete len:91 (+) Transcript_23913:299-571(+)|eukprot:CAMPEP_0118653374 /NCGR_PEP_ID=MMETSP0785-20121206/11798_1 /TAXON_ID=91992 /ORGANISM="Bolidomonas pacifica, Strain CCMP 1866" /LENGTH=90 /DNA_ID=CAMNT_0006545915 /DNA_START=422 /DNA_END=694 /DNA_ORIENTATION=-
MFSAARVATRLSTRGRRGIVDQMNKVESKIQSKRDIQNKGGTWQGAVNPTYLKQDGDMVMFAIGMGLISFAGLRLANGYWHMAHGTGKYE